MSQSGRLTQFISALFKLNIRNTLVCSNLVNNSRFHNVSQQNPEFHQRSSHCYQLILSGTAIAVAATKEEQTSPDEDKIIHMIKLARLARQRMDVNKSEQILHLAFRSAQELGHQKAQKYIIDEMANNAYELGDFRKAEKLFKELIKRLIVGGTPPNDNAIIHISAKLACLYGMFHKDAMAREGFNFCISNLKEKMSDGADDFDTKALYSLALSWYGEYLHSRGSNIESLDLFQESLEISKAINGPAHPHSLLQLNNMAAAYSVLNQLDRAATCLNNAINLCGEESEYASTNLPYYYINLVNIYLTQLENPCNESPLIANAARLACSEASKLAKKAGDKEAIVEVEKCLNALKKIS